MEKKNRLRQHQVVRRKLILLIIIYSNITTDEKYKFLSPSHETFLLKMLQILYFPSPVCIIFHELYFLDNTCSSLVFSFSTQFKNHIRPKFSKQVDQNSPQKKKVSRKTVTNFH